MIDLIISGQRFIDEEFVSIVTYNLWYLIDYRFDWSQNESWLFIIWL